MLREGTTEDGQKVPGRVAVLHRAVLNKIMPRPESCGVCGGGF